MNFFFYDTYNSRLNERYGDDLSTHLNLNLDLWLEVGSSSGLDRNRVYKLSNTTTENLETIPLMFWPLEARRLKHSILMKNMNDSLLIIKNSADW